MAPESQRRSTPCHAEPSAPSRLSPSCARPRGDHPAGQRGGLSVSAPRSPAQLGPVGSLAHRTRQSDGHVAADEGGDGALDNDVREHSAGLRAASEALACAARLWCRVV